MVVFYEFFSVLAIFLILMFGIILVYNSFQKSECPKPEVIYKLVPRSFSEEQENPVLVSDLFSKMFSGSSIIP